MMLSDEYSDKLLEIIKEGDPHALSKIAKISADLGKLEDRLESLEIKNAALLEVQKLSSTIGGHNYLMRGRHAAATRQDSVKLPRYIR